MTDVSRVHLGHRLAGGFVALFGGLMLWSFVTGDGMPRDAAWMFGMIGLAMGLGGSWIVGLYRWFPRLDPFETLLGAGLLYLGVFLAILMLPVALAPAPPGGDGPRWLGLVLPPPFIVAGLAFLGAFRRPADALRAAGIDPETLTAGGFVLFAGVLLMTLMAADGKGLVSLAGLPFAMAGVLMIVLTLRLQAPWWAVIQAGTVAAFVSAFAAGIVAIAWHETAVAWPGALILLYAAYHCWVEVLRLARGLRKAP